MFGGFRLKVLDLDEKGSHDSMQYLLDCWFL